MKLSITDYGLNFELLNKSPIVITIENNKLFQQLLQSMNSKDAYNSCGLKLIDDENIEIPLFKHSDFMMNPLAIDINNKNILFDLYMELSEYVNEKCTIDLADINSKLVALMDNMALGSFLPIDYNVNYTITDLLKLLKIRIDYESSDPLDLMVSYIKTLSRISKKRLLIICFLKDVFSNKDVSEIYKALEYEGVSVVVLEGHQFEAIQNERNYIIDKDLCLISF